MKQGFLSKFNSAKKKKERERENIFKNLYAHRVQAHTEYPWPNSISLWTKGSIEKGKIIKLSRSNGKLRNS